MIDLSRLTKKEIVKRANWKCPIEGHRKSNGLQHPNCYAKFHDIDLERICYLDIEAEGLEADYGIMFSYCVMDAKTGEVFEDSITKEDIEKYKTSDRNKMSQEDKRIVKNLIDILSKYNRVVTHYGSGFDLPFVRSRAVICNIPFPGYGIIYQTDTWVILRKKFKLSRNNLQNACLKLIGKSRKDHLSLSIKHGCLRGEEWAIKDTMFHCKKDVLDLRDLYEKINKYMRHTKSSI